MKIVAITQARLSSTRFPQKVLEMVDDVDSILSLHLKRIKMARTLNAVIAAIANEPGADLLLKVAENLSVECIRGEVNDVLDRFYQAAKFANADVVVRLTSDCPLVDPDLIDCVVEFFLSNKVDYVSTNLVEEFPDGCDIEVFSFKALERGWKEARETFDREHVTPFIWRNSDFKKVAIFSALPFRNVHGNFSSRRLTVDTPGDLDVIRELVKGIGKDRDWLSYVKFYDQSFLIKSMNTMNTRNEGYFKSRALDAGLRWITNFGKSKVYRSEVHKLIPGGAHTYSKGDDQFPELAPAAIERGLGAYVWDIDGNEFLDCSMGLTSVSLGHAYAAVNKKIKEMIDRGTNFQRPSALELETAKNFLSLTPCHEMIKFAKNGSAVTTAAVKLARARTGRKLIAFPSDHPFYSYDDWFIGKTVTSFGVPEEIKALSVTFKSDDLDSLKELFAKYPGQIACVISEPEKPHGLPPNYLEQAISFVQSQGALYILDEMITGFKTAFPGSLTKYNVKPDMATWGKGIANGYSFCALTGTREVMDLGGILQEGKDKLFLISTTHGGETHALAAVNATIEEFRSKKVLEHNHQIGRSLGKRAKSIIEAKGLSKFIDVQASEWMLLFTFKNKKNEVCQGMRTLMLQEMIRRGILFQGAFVPCFSHSEKDVDYFITAMDLSLEVYALALETGYESYLIGKPTKPVFRAKV